MIHNTRSVYVRIYNNLIIYSSGLEQRPNDEGGASSADDDGEFCPDLTLDWLQVTVFTIFGARKWLSKAK